MFARCVVLCALFGCGPDVSSPTDANSPNDTGTPAPSPTDNQDSGTLEDSGTPTDPGPQPGPVDVTVYQPIAASSQYEPAVGRAVFAAAADGTFVSRATTDAAGHAVLQDVPPNGSVTVAWVQTHDDADTFMAMTVMSVQPGEHIRFGDDMHPGAINVSGLLTVSLPGDSPTGSPYSTVMAQCGGIAGRFEALPVDQIPVGLFDTCKAGKTEVLAINHPDSNFTGAAGFSTGVASLTGTPASGEVTFGPWTSDHGTVRLAFDKDNELEGFVGAAFGPHYLMLGSHEQDPPTELAVWTHPSMTNLVASTQYGDEAPISARHEPVEVPANGSETVLPVRVTDFLPRYDVSIDADKRVPHLATTLTGDEQCGSVAVDAVRGWLLQLRQGKGVDPSFAQWTVLAPPDAALVMPQLDPEGDLAWPTEGDETNGWLELGAYAYEDKTYEDLRTAPDVLRLDSYPPPDKVTGVTCNVRTFDFF